MALALGNALCAEKGCFLGHSFHFLSEMNQTEVQQLYYLPWCWSKPLHGLHFSKLSIRKNTVWLPLLGIKCNQVTAGQNQWYPYPKIAGIHGCSPKYCLFSIGFNLYPRKRHSSIFVSLCYIDFNGKSRNTYRNASFFPTNMGVSCRVSSKQFLNLPCFFSMKYPILSCVT